jgi:hypothetical protein
MGNSKENLTSFPTAFHQIRKVEKFNLIKQLDDEKI